MAPLRFMCRHADAEMDVLLSETVPPADLSRIGIFRAPMSKHAKQARQMRGFQLCSPDRSMMPRRKRQTSNLSLA